MDCPTTTVPEENDESDSDSQSIRRILEYISGVWEKFSSDDEDDLIMEYLSKNRRTDRPRQISWSEPERDETGEDSNDSFLSSKSEEQYFAPKIRSYFNRTQSSTAFSNMKSLNRYWSTNEASDCGRSTPSERSLSSAELYDSDLSLKSDRSKDEAVDFSCCSLRSTSGYSSVFGVSYKSSMSKDGGLGFKIKFPSRGSQGSFELNDSDFSLKSDRSKDEAIDFRRPSFRTQSSTAFSNRKSFNRYWSTNEASDCGRSTPSERSLSSAELYDSDLSLKSDCSKEETIYFRRRSLRGRSLGSAELYDSAFSLKSDCSKEEAIYFRRPSFSRMSPDSKESHESDVLTSIESLKKSINHLGIRNPPKSRPTETNSEKAKKRRISKKRRQQHGAVERRRRHKKILSV